MPDCSSCDRGCSGCGNSLTLTPGEIQMLQTLGQIPFLPIARKADDPSPFYLEDDQFSKEEYSLILQLLEKKGLITLDFDQPLKNCDAAVYASFPIHGSMALTARGQSVLELLDVIGAEE